MEEHREWTPEIQEKITRLKHCRETIERLTKECEQLEKELAPYSTSIYTVKCPPEILIEIFRLYLSTNTRLIRRLLLVCKYWYSTAVRSPMLWMNIPIVIDTRKTDAKVVIDSISPRITAFLRHSRGMSLHLDINLEHLADTGGCIQKQMDYVHSQLSKSVRLDWLQPGSLNKWEIMKVAHEKPWNPLYAVDLLQLLAGTRGERMTRWGTLTLRMPLSNDGELLSPLWEIFKGDTPRLTELRIFSGEPFYTRKNRIFPVLPSLTRLELSNRVLLDLFTERREQWLGQVEHLAVPCDNPSDFATLNYFTHLRSLVTHMTNYSPDPPTRQATLKLQFLESVCFDKGATSTQKTTFLFPNIKHIRIERGRRRNLAELPDIQPKSASWFILQDHRDSWTASGISEALMDLLTAYHALEEVTIAERDFEQLMATIESLRSLGALLSSVIVIHTVNDSNREEVRSTFKVHDSYAELAA